MTFKKILFFSLIIHMTLFPHVSDENKPEEEKIGNFALPGSQRPGPALGFGQNVVDKGTLITYFLSGNLFGKKKTFNTIIPNLVYGIRDNLSLLVEFPIAVRFKDNNYSSSGPSDLAVQLEYNFYHKGTPTSTVYATAVGAMSFPIGNPRKVPSTGLGSPSFFLGTTVARLATDWYCYTSYGALLTTKHGNHNKPGNHFVYQAGLGRNIAYATDKWILTWELELSGAYDQKAQFHGITNQNSGGNTIYLGPALWFSTKRLYLLASIAPIVSQHLFGEQLKDNVYISLFLGLTFH